MAYTVLARKYRPQRFDDLVGQEHVSRTLTNAIKSERVAHAFLFTGARGVGKTTTARLLAKALNCEKGPTPNPCNACAACTQITQGTNMDVLEIDGASHNGVDDVRSLQESLPYRPANGRFKVVIVDEVHMLSGGAFNAFLKTLEEPPEHVKFILATTELHKVPITIRSRCQRHDFRLIKLAEIATRICEILASEKIEADDAGVAIVAREAAGSMRDALTVLDQLLAFGGNALRGAEVAAGLGIADREAVMRVTEALLEGEPARCVEVVAKLAEDGLDLLHFARQLVQIQRDLVVIKVVGLEGAHVDLPDAEVAWAKATVEARTSQELERAFAGLSKLIDEVAQSAHPQIVLEMGLVRLADRPPLAPLSELFAKLDALGSGGAGGGARSRAAGDDRRADEGRAQRPERSAVGDVEAPRVRGSAPGGVVSGAPGAPHAAVAGPVPRERPREAASASPGAAAQPSRIVRPRGERAERASTPPRAGTMTAGARTAADDGSAGPPEWLPLLDALRDSQPALGAILEHAVAIEVSPQRVRLNFPEGSFFGKQASAESAKDAIAEAARRLFGERPVVEVAFGTSTGMSVASRNEARNEREEARTKQEALDHPRVKDAIAVFPEAAGSVQVEIE
jgi:DNA polymerase-3 subunit gamma/tau